MSHLPSSARDVVARNCISSEHYVLVVLKKEGAMVLNTDLVPMQWLQAFLAVAEHAGIEITDRMKQEMRYRLEKTQPKEVYHGQDG